MTSIYALVDPESGCVRYIGKTSNWTQRRYSHRSVDKSDRSRRALWLRWLAKFDLYAEMIELEAVEGNGADAERFWIASLRAAGAQLLNGSDGGDHLVEFTFEVRAKLAAASKLTHTGLKRPPETGRRISAALLANHPMRGKHHSMATKLRMSTVSRPSISADQRARMTACSTAANKTRAKK